MDYDDYNDPEDEAKSLNPVPPVTPVSRKRGISRPDIGRTAQRMQAWDQQKERQLGFKWKRNLKGEVLKTAVSSINKKLDAADSLFTVTVAGVGAGFTIELHEKGSGVRAARSQTLSPGQINSGNAERIIIEFCKEQGVRFNG